jgi:hypothetical protein
VPALLPASAAACASACACLRCAACACARCAASAFAFASAAAIAATVFACAASAVRCAFVRRAAFVPCAACAVCAACACAVCAAACVVVFFISILLFCFARICVLFQKYSIVRAYALMYMIAHFAGKVKGFSVKIHYRQGYRQRQTVYIEYIQLCCFVRCCCVFLCPKIALYDIEGHSYDNFAANSN